MRIDHLELTRYGKFTERPIEMPKAKRDFHLIIGPNEAGKFDHPRRDTGSPVRD